MERGVLPHEVVAALARELQARAPTVLVLEDLHWGDEATLDVLQAACAQGGDGSRRDRRELPRRRARPVAAAADRGRRACENQAVARLRLAPLSPAAVARLAEPHGVDSDELYRKTAGNPFFVVEALATQGDDVPDTVREAVFARTARLSGSAKQLLEPVSIVQGSAELWLLEALAGEAIDGLDECVTSGMLTHVPAGVAFRHELARLAVEDSVPLNRKVELHRQALEALADPPGGARDLARIAYHAEAAGDADAVGRFAPAAAAGAASLGAHREAAAQYARALRFGGPASRRRAREAPGGPLARVLLHRSVRRRHRGARTGARDPPSAGRQARGRRRAPSALRVPLVPGPDGGIRHMRPRCGLAA